MVVRKPGVQKPHCSPWHSENACCTGLSRPSAEPSTSVSPSTVVISRSTAETANIRHERIGRPSTSTVQAPQTPCSQPTWVPVRPRSWRSASDSKPASGYGDVVGDAVDVQPDVVERLRHCAKPPWAIFLAAATTRAVSTRTSWAR